MTDEKATPVTWYGLFGLLAPLVLGAATGIWALFSLARNEAKQSLDSHASQEHPTAVSSSEHDRAVRRIEVLESRIDTLWQRPSLAEVEIDGQQFQGRIYGLTATGQEVFESPGVKATRSPGGNWRVIWRRKD